MNEKSDPDHHHASPQSSFLSSSCCRPLSQLIPAAFIIPVTVMLPSSHQIPVTSIVLVTFRSRIVLS